MIKLGFFSIYLQFYCSVQYFVCYVLWVLMQLYYLVVTFIISTEVFKKNLMIVS